MMFIAGQYARFTQFCMRMWVRMSDVKLVRMVSMVGQRRVSEEPRTASGVRELDRTLVQIRLYIKYKYVFNFVVTLATKLKKYLYSISVSQRELRMFH
jgi:hypothetical protein